MKRNVYQCYNDLLAIMLLYTCLCYSGAIKAQTARCISPEKSIKIGILVAMEKEMQLLEGYFSDRNIIVKQCGMGKVNAAVGCVDLIRESQPDVIISMGCAGGYGEEIQIGDVIVSTETAYHDVYCGIKSIYGQMQGMPSRFIADSTLLKNALQLDAKIKPGLIVTGDWFVDSKEKMREIINHFSDAKAVDMESTAIAQTCYLMHVPFISFRIISDKPLEDEHASQYYNFWDNASEETFRIAKQFVESLINQNKNN